MEAGLRDDSLRMDSGSLERSKHTRSRFLPRQTLVMKLYLFLQMGRVKDIESSGSHISLASLTSVGHEQASITTVFR